MQIRRTFEDDLTHQRTREVYSAYNKEREEQIQSRKDQVLLAQLRSGKHMAFMEFRHMLDESVSEMCPRCVRVGAHTGTLAAEMPTNFGSESRNFWNRGDRAKHPHQGAKEGHSPG